MSEIVNKIAELCNGMDYSDSPSDETIQLAKDNNCIIIRGRSDDLMQVYGVDCELTENRGHGEHECYDGSDFSDLDTADVDEYWNIKKLKQEIGSIGLVALWHGAVEAIETGCFTYTVKDCVKSADFKVMEDDAVYCTGKVIQMKLEK